MFLRGVNHLVKSTLNKAIIVLILVLQAKKTAILITFPDAFSIFLKLATISKIYKIRQSGKLEGGYKTLGLLASYRCMLLASKN